MIRLYSMLLVGDLSLNLFNTSSGIYLIKKESKYTGVFLSISNKTKCFPLLCLSSKIITDAPVFILGN